MPFSIAYADAAGARIAGSELQLTPGPSAVEYPTEVAGVVLETANGRVVHQQPAADARRRAWIWSGYPADHPAYDRVWTTLQFLRSRWRFENALSPFVYLKDDVTGELSQRTWVSRTTNGAATLTFLSSGAAWTTNEFAGRRVLFPLIGSGGLIVSNTSNTFTLSSAIASVPDSSKFLIEQRVAPWVRVRVLDLSRELRGNGGNPVFENSRMVFVVDDPTFESVR